MATKRTDDVYRTIEVEDKDGIRIITFNDSMKETVFRDPDGNERTDFTPINVHELDRLNALYEATNEQPEEDYEPDDDNPDWDHPYWDDERDWEREHWEEDYLNDLKEMNEAREQSRGDDLELER